MQQFDYIVDLMKIAVEDARPIRITGRVTEVKGTIIKAVVPAVQLGEICNLRNPDGAFDLQAAPDIIEPGRMGVGRQRWARCRAEAGLADDVDRVDASCARPQWQIAQPHGRSRRAAMEQHDGRGLLWTTGEYEGLALACRQ